MIITMTLMDEIFQINIFNGFQLCKACSKRRATAVPNLNESDLAMARQQHGVVSNVKFNSVAPNSKTTKHA